MICRFSKEALALYVEGDLHDEGADIVRQHLGVCAECRRFLDQLHSSQAQLKSLGGGTIGHAACAQMRRAVMSTINGRKDLFGWRLRIERMLVLGLQPGAYALAAAVILGIVSVSLVGQVRHRRADPSLAAARDNSLHRPEGYRDWIALESKASAAADRVYLNPTGYHEYAKSGAFPEGTMLVREPGGSGHDAAHRPDQGTGLLVSVKDSTRFEGGWGFFEFSDAEGSAAEVREATGCRTCHRDNAATDHVFTQSYRPPSSASHDRPVLHPRS